MKYEKLEQLILSAEDPGELIDDVIAYAEILLWGQGASDDED